MNIDFPTCVLGGAILFVFLWGVFLMAYEIGNEHEKRLSELLDQEDQEKEK